MRRGTDHQRQCQEQYFFQATGTLPSVDKSPSHNPKECNNIFVAVIVLITEINTATIKRLTLARINDVSSTLSNILCELFSHILPSQHRISP